MGGKFTKTRVKNKAVKDFSKMEKKVKVTPQTISKSTNTTPCSCSSVSTNTSCSYSNVSTNTYTCPYSDASTNTSFPDSTSNKTISSKPAAASTALRASSSSICSHSTQCIERQPKPPPPDKCSILQHTGSKYHEHLASTSGVPARYHTHENCMEIDHHNYGCRDCVWYKWWGELHGYPDINPWDFKKHLDPSEWPALGLW